MTTYREQYANVVSQGWGEFMCTEEDKAGRTIRMPQWVMDDICRNVDASNLAAVRTEEDGRYRIVDAYLSEELDDEVYDDFVEATLAADRYNDDRDSGPLVLPRSFAIINAPGKVTA
jgi:hypothetical protein